MVHSFLRENEGKKWAWTLTVATDFHLAG